MNKTFLLETLFLGSFLLGICGFSIPLSASEATASSEIRNVLVNWSKDFNAKNIPEVCGLFAPDLVASFPNTPDRNYHAMCKQLTAALENPEKTFLYDPPQIEDIVVSGNLAIVRLIWTSRMTSSSAPGELIIKEKGMDVFKRQADGTWKISISYAFEL